MKVFRGLPNADARKPCALAIGNFDGVHRGHRALLSEVRMAADRLGLDAAVMTFEPHPREFFAQLAGDLQRAPTRIANLRDKLESLSAAGVDRVIVEHFNAAFSGMSPEHFVQRVLVEGLHVKWLMVGEDFRFGAKRAGDVAMLQAAGAALGFEVHALPNVMHEGLRISSSEIRVALAAGELVRARDLLGHDYAISGHVVHGQKLGRTIGFPTLNLRIAHRRPALSGIFAVRVHGLQDTPMPAVASMGVRPTVDDSGRTLLETFVFDYSGQCYGKIVRIEFLQKIRDEQKYPDLATLTAAIAQDTEAARHFFAQPQRSMVSVTDRI